MSGKDWCRRALWRLAGVVITDRVVLDKQLQDTIYQLEHERGVVAKVGAEARRTGTAKSAKLTEALTGGRAKVVITTMQTFSFILESAADLPDRRYADRGRGGDHAHLKVPRPAQ